MNLLNYRRLFDNKGDKENEKAGILQINENLLQRNGGKLYSLTEAVDRVLMKRGLMAAESIEEEGYFVSFRKHKSSKKLLCKGRKIFDMDHKIITDGCATSLVLVWDLHLVCHLTKKKIIT